MSRCVSVAKIALLSNVLFINSISLSFSISVLQNMPQASRDFYKGSLIYSIRASGQKQISIL